MSHIVFIGTLWQFWDRTRVCDTAGSGLVPESEYTSWPKSIVIQVSGISFDQENLNRDFSLYLNIFSIANIPISYSKFNV